MIHFELSLNDCCTSTYARVHLKTFYREPYHFLVKELLGFYKLYNFILVYVRMCIYLCIV
jgi:hypothetical protein